ncbi:predicted protein [Nematostella vectensis]|uniref:Uncharacterized protein n=1 Tax=Nematostella vectensis TaxID=45351 RepID=A7T048_NEMVE|nr:predicted protein [Nematostella vectensis]|eukprot:XP_001622767.1 predicted protein [Nematostella vectensis]
MGSCVEWSRPECMILPSIVVIAVLTVTVSSVNTQTQVWKSTRASLFDRTLRRLNQFFMSVAGGGALGSRAPSPNIFKIILK